MKITILVFNNVATTVYEQAGLFIKNTTGIDPVFEFKPINNPTPPLKIYGQDSIGDWWGMDFDYLNLLSSGKFTQAICIPSDAYRVLSCSFVAGQGESQISQVNTPEWSLIIHELIHGFFTYVGIPDSQDPASPGLHKLIRDNGYDAVQAFTKALEQLAPHYADLNSDIPTISKPLFPLDIKVPIYGAGFNAWRTINGIRQRHQAQDFVARQWEVKAPEDGFVRYFWDKEGGNMINFTGDMYDYQMAHLKKLVKPANVKKGDVIAITDNTGQNTTGQHLHFGVKTKQGKWVDPLTINWEETKKFMLLMRNSAGEIALYTGSLKHPIRNFQFYVEYLDSAPFVQVTDDYYNSIPNGKALPGSSLGGIEEPQGTDVIL